MGVEGWRAQRMACSGMQEQVGMVECVCRLAPWCTCGVEGGAHALHDEGVGGEVGVHVVDRATRRLPRIPRVVFSAVIDPGGSVRCY